MQLIQVSEHNIHCVDELFVFTNLSGFLIWCVPCILLWKWFLLGLLTKICISIKFGAIFMAKFFFWNASVCLLPIKCFNKWYVVCWIGLSDIFQFSTSQNILFLFYQREKMSGLTSYVPVVRKTLETLIFRVKGMLVANNSPDAFWMGNLKNKTITGDEILSQVCILCGLLLFPSLMSCGAKNTEEIKLLLWY